MRDVAGRQAQGLDFGKLPVHGLGGDESPEGREGGVDALRPAPLPRVGRAPLLHHHRVSIHRARQPPPLLRGAAVALLRAAVALAAVLVVVRRDRQVRVDQVRRHGPEHGESHRRLIPIPEHLRDLRADAGRAGWVHLGEKRGKWSPQKEMEMEMELEEGPPLPAQLGSYSRMGGAKSSSQKRRDYKNVTPFPPRLFHHKQPLVDPRLVLEAHTPTRAFQIQRLWMERE